MNLAISISSNLFIGWPSGAVTPDSKIFYLAGDPRFDDSFKTHSCSPMSQFATLDELPPFLKYCLLLTSLNNLCAFLERKTKNLEGLQVTRPKWLRTDGSLFGNGPLYLQRLLWNRTKPRSVIICPSSSLSIVIYKLERSIDAFTIWPKMSLLEREYCFGNNGLHPEALSSKSLNIRTVFASMSLSCNTNYALISCTFVLKTAISPMKASMLGNITLR